MTRLKTRIGWPADRRGFLARSSEYIALGLLILAVSTINVVWIVQDTRPQPANDPNVYLFKTLEFIDRLGEQGGAQLWQSIATMSLAGRPPLYQVLSVPFIFFLGRSQDAALSLNVIFGAILLLSTYGIGRLAGNGKTGLLAALLVVTYPPLVNLSRIYAPWFALPACVALSLWLLLLLLKTRSVKIAWLLGASLGFGMLIRHYHSFLLPSTALFGLYMLLFQTDPKRPSSPGQVPRWLVTKLRDPFALRGLLPGVLIAAGLTASWYLPQRQSILALQQTIQSGWTGEVAYGFPGVPPSFWWYVLTAPGAISTVLTVLLAIGLVVSTIRWRLGPAVLVVTFLLMYGGLGLMTASAWIGFAPALPVAAALTAVGVFEVRNLIFAGKRHGSSKTGGSRFVRVSDVDRQQGRITVMDLGELSFGRLRAPSRAIVDGQTLTVRLPPDTELWDSIERGTALQITPNIDAAMERSASAPSRGSEGQVEPTQYSVRLAPGMRIGRLLSAALILVCIGVALFDFSVVTWGVGPWSRPIAIALGAPLDSPTCVGPMSRLSVAFCSAPAQGGDWRVSDILRVILDDPGCEGRRCHLVVVPRLDTFERSIFDYHLVRDFPQSRERIIVSRADSPRADDPYNPGWLRGDYLVYIPGLETGKRLLVALARLLEYPPSLFADAHEQVAALPLPKGLIANVVRRTKPLTLEEASLSIAALNIPEEGKSMMLRQLQEQLENETAAAAQEGPDWSLAAKLASVQAYSDDTELVWWLDSTWARPPPYDQDVFVAPSTLSVGGLVRPDQLHLHPFSTDQNTYVRFDIEECRYGTIQIGYGLADQVAGLSNGVRYVLEASVDGGDSYTVLWDVAVTNSEWQSQTLSLAAYWGKDVTFQLAVDAMGNYDRDWLQTTVHLLPALEE